MITTLTINAWVRNIADAFDDVDTVPLSLKIMRQLLKCIVEAYHHGADKA